MKKKTPRKNAALKSSDAHAQTKRFWDHHLCKTVFLLSLLAGILLIPLDVWREQTPLALVFLIVFAATTTFTLKVFREGARAVQGHGIVNLISSLLGLAALEACSTGFVCGAASIGILSILVPGIMAPFLSEHAVQLVWLSIIVQMVSLHLMGGFRNNRIWHILVDG